MTIETLRRWITTSYHNKMNVQNRLIDVSCFVVFLVIISTTLSFLVKYFIINIFLFSLQISNWVFFNSKRTQQNIIVKVLPSSCKMPVILCDFKQTWITPQCSSKISLYSMLRKFSQWKQTCFMRMKGLTDRRDEANSRFYLLYKSKWKQKQRR
jgi:hypothetical protein